MNFIPEINPFFEASIYLSQRFIQDRASKRIADHLPDSSVMPNMICAYYKRIAELEAELDELIPDDDLLRTYFTPLNTKDDKHENVLTIGGMLLAVPSRISYSFCYNDLLVFFENVPISERLSHFRDTSLTAFIDEPGVGYDDLASFMTLADNILVDSSDKWAFIDAASNPIRHLKQMQPLLDKVCAIIQARSAEFSSLVEKFGESFFASHDIAYIFKKLNILLDPSAYSDIQFIPSLFLFNGLVLTSSSGKSLAINIGIFVDKIFELRDKIAESDKFMGIIKVLSDNTRLKALHFLCDRYSFGQELAEQLGGSRNAMYYHLEKLMGIGLIDCKVTEYRMLYTMNKPAVYEKLTALRDFLVDNWKPEDDD